MEIHSEQAADAIKDWPSLHKAYRAFAACDDGALAEGFSDRVEYLMTYRWREMGEFLPLKTDSAFAKFVLRHVDETMSETGLKQIAHNAHADCPVGYRAFCRSIERAAASP